MPSINFPTLQFPHPARPQCLPYVFQHLRFAQCDARGESSMQFGCSAAREGEAPTSGGQQGADCAKSLPRLFSV